MKRILVTGGAGYIGSHTCKALSRAGYLPIVVDSLENGHKSFVKWGPFHQVDILDEDRLKVVMNAEGIEAIVHFAAYAYVGESMTNPARYYSNNVSGSLSLLKAAQKCGIDKIIFSSTCATYGPPVSPTLLESHPQNPINPYGFSKLVVEKMLQDFGRAYGMQSICLRYFNAAGADRDLEIGELHDPETHLIPLVLRAALYPSESVTVFGNDYDTADGTCVRDYIHVTDLAQAHVLALQALISGQFSSAYNLGNGRGFSVLEVIRAVERLTGKAVNVKYGKRRAGDPASLIAASDLARKELGWMPQFPDLDSIVDTAYRFMLKNVNLDFSAKEL